jgi:hypothetical protein
MDTAEKTRENRLRRMLDRRGYTLQKSRARDPRDLTYNGYQIVDTGGNYLVAGLGNAKRGFALSLDGVEDWLRSN